MPNEVILVTGANNGIGLGLVRALAEDGYRVGAFDLSGENLAGLRFHACDVTQAPRVVACVGAVLAEWGRIDVLVNNACLAIFLPFEERSLAGTARGLEVNYS